MHYLFSCYICSNTLLIYLDKILSRIINISEAASLAIHSMAIIASTDKRMNVLEIATLFNFSKNHLAKVMQMLVKGGYLKSTRGPSGGFTLNKDAKDVNLLEIYELIEGSISGRMCNMCLDDCIFEPCIYGGLGDRVKNDVKEYLENTTIQDLKTKLTLKKQ